MRALFIPVSILFIILAGIFLFFREEKPVLNLSDKNISLIIADTDAERIKGLGGIKSLPENTAMLFVFDSPAKHDIWMKGMQFPIDILWIDGEKKILHIEENISPDTYPKTFSGSDKSLYVLEANAGFSAENNLQVGDILDFVLIK